jgi:hypothetical protein
MEKKILSNSKSRFMITVDTEADNSWSSPEKIEMKNFEEIPRFQELCEMYDIIPVYLLTYEYATYKPAIKYLKPKLEQGKCDIGHHLHVWSTPPFQNEMNGIDMDWLHAYQYELPDDLFYEKANCLKDAIITSFGKHPIIHRAGRWGIDDRTIDWMSDNDFLIDSSVTPGINLSGNLGKLQFGPDFSNESGNPYLWETKRTKTIIELPVTVIVKRGFLSPFTLFIKRIVQNNYSFEKIMRKIHNTKMLRPHPKYELSFYKKAIGKHAFINMMIHSSELAFGCSPYTQTREDYNAIWKILEFTFSQVKNNRMQSIFPFEINDIL